MVYLLLLTIVIDYLKFGRAINFYEMLGEIFIESTPTLNNILFEV